MRDTESINELVNIPLIGSTVSGSVPPYIAWEREREGERDGDKSHDASCDMSPDKTKLSGEVWC